MAAALGLGSSAGVALRTQGNTRICQLIMNRWDKGHR